MKFTGTGVALVTPFNADNKIDRSALKAVVNHVIQGGVDYLVVMGTTAESVVLSAKEKTTVIETVLEINRDRLPVVLGIGGNNTLQVTHDIEKQDFSGISGLLSVSPYYNKPNQTGIYEHYKAIAAASPVHVIIYNVPGRTGSFINAETTLKLAQIPKIIATKEASGNFESIMEIIKNRDDNFAVISGDDALTLPLISLGADGVISVIANALPHNMSRMVEMTLSNQYDVARELHYDMIELIGLIFKEGNPAGVKAAMQELKILNDFVRLPLTKVSESLRLLIQKDILRRV